MTKQAAMKLCVGKIIHKFDHKIGACVLFVVKTCDVWPVDLRAMGGGRDQIADHNADAFHTKEDCVKC